MRAARRSTLANNEALAIFQVSKKRSIFLRAPTPEAKICWELCFNAIAKTAKKINQESVA